MVVAAYSLGSVSVTNEENELQSKEELNANNQMTADLVGSSLIIEFEFGWKTLLHNLD